MERAMIDFSKIKNKAIVTINHGAKDIDVEVVNDTPSACVVKLPDGSIMTVGKMHVKAIKPETPVPSAIKE
jgi:hypothetical protein